MSETQDYNLQPFAAPEVAPKSTVGWLLWPMVVGLSLLLLAVVVGADRYFVPALLAWVNVTIGGLAIVYFLRQRTLQALIPVLFLPITLVAHSFSTIYFAIFSPDVQFGGMSGGYELLLDGTARYQAGILVFLVCYLIPTCLLIRKSAVPPPAVARNVALRFAKLLTWAGIIVLGAATVAKALSLPGGLRYFCEGTLLYATPMFFGVGLLITIVPWRVRINGLLSMIAMGALMTVANSRAGAMLPVGLFVAGLLFGSDVSSKWKRRILITGAILIPIYMVIGNVTRNKMESSGFTDMGKRLEAMSHWREYLMSGSIMDRSMTRLYFFGARAIFVHTPEDVPYMDISFSRYFGEIVTRILVPGGIYYRPHYTNNALLLNYDIRISKTTSTEISIPGSLWMIGGWIPLVIGAFVLGLFHVWLAHVLAKADARSPIKALFYLTMVSTAVFTGIGTDIISQAKIALYHLWAAMLLYHLVVKHLLGLQEGALSYDLAVAPQGP